MSKIITYLLVLLALFAFPAVSSSLIIPDLILQADPVHLGDTNNNEWNACFPSVPSAWYGECITISFDLTQEQANSLAYLLIKSSGASSDTSGKLYFDDNFLGIMPHAIMGTRCDFYVDCYYVAPSLRSAGPHEVKVCTSIYNFGGTRMELDDIAFFDLRFVVNTDSIPVETKNTSWGKIKNIYSD